MTIRDQIDEALIHLDELLDAIDVLDVAVLPSVYRTQLAMVGEALRRAVPEPEQTPADVVQAVTPALRPLTIQPKLVSVEPSPAAAAANALRYTPENVRPETRQLIEQTCGTRFAPSPYQFNIFAWVLEGEGNALVNAVAGSGKTTTLEQAAKLLRKSAVFVAFNKHIADELANRLRGTSMSAKTIHSVGMAAIQQHLDARPQVRTNKYRELLDQRLAALRLPAELGATETTRKTIAEAAKALVNFCRTSLVDPADTAAVLDLCEHFGIELPSDLLPHVTAIVADVLATGERLARETASIDFTDMLWLPLRWHIPLPQVPWIFVDEAQDLNTAQRRLVLGMLAPGGRSLWVGDPRQAIYGFAGADSESFWRIQHEAQAELLPLSVCYRCPVSHVALAREIVPQIEAAPGAIDGEIDEVPEDALPPLLADGDLILCRLTSPLIGLCMRLIAQHKAARVRGRDIGKQLTDVVRAVAMHPAYQGWDTLGSALSAYEMDQRAKLASREDAESLLEALTDRCEAVRTVYQSFNASNPAGLIAQIEGLFSDETTPITLSTVHRAKGLENDRVFILRPDKLPLTWPKQKPWEAEQEQHLRYVALTRAKQALVFIEG